MCALPKTSPINPVVRACPFDDSDYLFELKYDGFRAMAYFQGGTCDLVSRNKHVFGGFKELREWFGQNVRVRDAIIDGEICCLDETGTPQFNDLTTGTRPPYFATFDLLWRNGRTPSTGKYVPETTSAAAGVASPPVERMMVVAARQRTPSKNRSCCCKSRQSG
jgi:ATP-dependent DNA ligase